MNSKEDGGPAFGEFKQVGECSIKTGGITVRDYFAAKALAGRCALPGSFDVESEAKICYQLADAMLAARGESK